MSAGYPEYVIRIELEDPYGKRFSAIRRINASALRSSIGPVDVCDDPFIAFVTGGVTRPQLRTVNNDRKKLAEQIAAQITDGIIKTIEKQDTTNGYPR